MVFELKRGTLSRDAVAQVIDYASYLDSLDNDRLAQLIAGNSGSGGIEQINDFQDWYSDTGEGDGLESLKPIRTVLVGLGVDERTERMVNFLSKNSSMDISLLTLHGFHHQGKTLLARQMRVKGGVGPPDDGRQTRRVDREANQRWLLARVDQYGITELFDEVNQYFTRLWGGASRRARRSGFAFRLRGTETAIGTAQNACVCPS